MQTVVRRLLVVLAVVGAGLVPAPATAAGLCSGSGVSVVVDFGALGGGIRTGCDATGNRNAAKAFADTGHPLTYAQRQPGFVCRVDGAPASDPCVNTSPADAYWGLYWSDGTSGWKYSTLGVGSLTVPAGGSVAFSWQDGGTADPPGARPASSAPSPGPSPVSTPRPTRTPTTAKPGSSSHAGAAKPSAAVTPSATGSATASASASPSPGGSSTPIASPSGSATTPTGTATPVAAAPVGARLDDSAPDGGLPWWLPVGLLLGLGGVGAVVWRARRQVRR
jgi:hypothetical protein